MRLRPGSRTPATVQVVTGGQVRTRPDYLATEEPLEIRLHTAAAPQTLAVTMRTPGHDFELAAGFLYGEGVVSRRESIRSIGYCTDPGVDAEQRYNIVTVELDPRLDPDLEPLERHFYTTSACGVCGKASLEALEIRGCTALPPGPQVEAGVLSGLPESLRRAQGIFQSTGGLHAAALFDARGGLLTLREDVGRHNALDKVVGWALLREELPLAACIVMVSGRASFEIMQKSLRAGAPIVCAVSAPSSLAVDVARRFGMTLVGFLRGRQFNVYAGAERVRATAGRE